MIQNKQDQPKTVSLICSGFWVLIKIAFGNFLATDVHLWRVLLGRTSYKVRFLLTILEGRNLFQVL